MGTPIVPPFGRSYNRLVICASCILLAFPLVTSVAGADIEQEWVISYKSVNPDGVSKVVPVVNGQYPGPQINGVAGQTVRILVINRLPTESTSIHWHGIKQDGTPWNDGVPGVTQCTIPPGESFLYEFKLDAPGTLWWHSHSGLQKSSLYGAIIISGDEHRPTIGTHEERTLLLNDWYHKSSSEQLEGLLRPVEDFSWVGNPQSLLINGRGEYDCDSEDAIKKCDEDHPDANLGPFVLDVMPNTTYRLHLVGTSSLTFLTFGIESHVLDIVEVETTPVHPLSTRYVDLGSGQSCSVLLKTKTEEELANVPNNNGLFWMQLFVSHREVDGLQGFAILRYASRDPDATMPIRETPHIPDRGDNAVHWSLRQSRSLLAINPVEQVPKTANRRFTILGTQNVLDDGRLGWAINNISYVDGGSPILHSVKLGVDVDTDSYVSRTEIPPDYDNTVGVAKTATHVIQVEKDEVVDFVFQNGPSLNGVIEVHPW